MISNVIITSQVCGVKGPTILALHQQFDLVGGVVVDDLHGIYLGVTLRLLHLWFDRTSRGKPFFIGYKVSIMDALHCMALPSTCYAVLQYTSMYILHFGYVY